MTSSSLLYPSSHQGTSDSRLPLVTCDRRGEGAGFSGRSLSEAPTRWRAADWTEVCRQAWAHRVTGSWGPQRIAGQSHSFVFSCWCRPLPGEKALKEITANKVGDAI